MGGEGYGIPFKNVYLSAKLQKCQSYRKTLLTYTVSAMNCGQCYRLVSLSDLKQFIPRPMETALERDLILVPAGPPIHGDITAGYLTVFQFLNTQNNEAELEHL